MENLSQGYEKRIGHDLDRHLGSWDDKSGGHAPDASSIPGNK